MNTKLLMAAFAIVIAFASCKKTEDETPDMPSTYNFDNVSYSGQTDRLNMLAEMTTEMKKSNSGNTVDGTALMNMFSNSSSPFTNTDLNSSTKQLKNKCFSGSTGAYNTATFEYLINYLATQSASAGNTWAPGTAGVATSGSKSYFFDAYGVEYTQIIEKGLMGAVFYYQIAETYTREGKIGDAVDNTTVTDGEGTDMEHHWDEAFGYFGAPTSFSASTYETAISNGDARYHAKYAGVGQDAGLTTVEKVMAQYIKGRWGISNNDYTARDEAAEQLRKEYELILATTAIHYLNSAKANFADDALRNHALSEAVAFILSLYYNADKVITNSQLTTLRAYFEETPQGSPTAVFSFNNVTTADLNAAITLLSTTYQLDSVKDVL